MKAFAKNIEALVLAFILLLSVAFVEKAQAACQVKSCVPVFASDINLTTQVSSLQQKSLSAFAPTDLYVGYEVGTCDGTAKISYCADVWRGLPPLNLCNAPKVDASGFLLTNVGSKKYLVSKVPGSAYNDPYSAYPRAGVPPLNAMQTNIWDGSNWACANDGRINTSYLSEACSITPTASKASDGSYLVSVTINGSQLIPEKGYKTIFTSLNSLEVNPVVQANVFTVVDGAQNNIQQRFQGVRVDAGTYNVCVVPNESNDVISCASQKCMNSVVLDNTTPTSPPVFATPVPVVGGSDAAAVQFQLCGQTGDAPSTPGGAGGPDYNACLNCVGSGNILDPNASGQQLWTAIGCVSLTKEGIVTSLLRVGIGISGGFVLLSILYGAFLLTTSSGDPKRVQEGQEMITSAVMGLMFVIFSVIILKFIGVTILHIPGFGA